MPRDEPVITKSEQDEALSFAEKLTLAGLQGLIRHTDMQWWVAETFRGQGLWTDLGTFALRTSFAPAWPTRIARVEYTGNGRAKPIVGHAIAFLHPETYEAFVSLRMAAVAPPEELRLAPPPSSLERMTRPEASTSEGLRRVSGTDDDARRRWPSTRP